MGLGGGERGCCGVPAVKEDISRFAVLHEFCSMHFAGKDSVPWKEGTFLRAAPVYEVQVWVDSGGKKLPMPSGHYLFLIIQISHRDMKMSFKIDLIIVCCYIRASINQFISFRYY